MKCDKMQYNTKTYIRNVYVRVLINLRVSFSFSVFSFISLLKRLGPAIQYKKLTRELCLFVVFFPKSDLVFNNKQKCIRVMDMGMQCENIEM